MTSGTRAADLAGRVLGAVFGAVGRIRPADKPLHPIGRVATGTLTRTGAAGPTGVAWLDEPGEDHVLVRVSRSAGLPAPLPDVHGLAIRVEFDGDTIGDLLFSGTGSGPLTRFLIRPGVDLASGKLGTMMPYRTPQGGRVLAAEAREEDDRVLATLFVAPVRGPWQPFATLVSEPLQPDTERATSFDAVLNPVPGLQPYEWVAALRERSYRAARRSRGATAPLTAHEADLDPVGN